MAHERLLKNRRGRHSLSEAGREFVKLFRKTRGIQSWFPARIGGGSRQRKLDFEFTTTGLKAIVSGNGMKQEIYLVTEEPRTVRQELTQAWV